MKFLFVGNNSEQILTAFSSSIQESDPVVEKLYATSEEGQKVTRNKGDKFVAIYRRIPSN